MKIPKALTKVIESFQRLPGIGPKTAQRLGYYLLHVPQSQLTDFAQGLENLKKNTVLCSICKNVSETNPCDICEDRSRDTSSILVVEQPLDVVAIERTKSHKGLYHVLHGKISPLENIGPDEIFTRELFERLDGNNGETHSANLPAGKAGASRVKEIIIATNPTMEGEATAMYISRKVNETKKEIKVTRLGMGIPTGADVEYADENTLTQALQGRREMGK